MVKLFSYWDAMLYILTSEGVLPTSFVAYFDQLLGAARTQKLVKRLYLKKKHFHH